MGLVAGLALGFALVQLRVFFPGDAKLIAAFGAICGAATMFRVTLLAVFLLAIQGIVVLALKGELRRVAERMFVWASLRQARVKADLALTGLRMPAAPAFLLAALIVGGGLW